MSSQAKADEMLKKYGQLNWFCNEETDEEKAKEGKRYEGCHVLINLSSGGILDCYVVEVTIEGMRVRPMAISMIDDGDDVDLDCFNIVPFKEIVCVFLAP